MLLHAGIENGRPAVSEAASEENSVILVLVSFNFVSLFHLIRFVGSSRSVCYIQCELFHMCLRINKMADIY